MLAAHWPASTGLLQVPQTSIFSAVRLVCAWFVKGGGGKKIRMKKLIAGGDKPERLTIKKAEDVWERKEKGRHWRKGSDSVIFVKDNSHEFVVKLLLRLVSNGWGKGVGRTGGDIGTVGTVWVPVWALVGLDDDDDNDDDGKTIDEAPAASEAAPEDVGARIVLIVGIVCPRRCSGCVVWPLQLAALATWISGEGPSSHPVKRGKEKKLGGKVRKKSAKGTTMAVKVVSHAIRRLRSWKTNVPVPSLDPYSARPDCSEGEGRGKGGGISFWEGVDGEGEGISSVRSENFNAAGSGDEGGVNMSGLLLETYQSRNQKIKKSVRLKEWYELEEGSA
jgi:hypothetical protein